MSALHRQVMKRNMPLLPPSGALARHKRVGGPRDYSPLDWSGYFDSFIDLLVPQAEGTFRLYLSNMVLEEDNINSPLVILLHGAGYSGLSWGVFVKELMSLVHVKIVAIDLRGHGSTKTSDDSDLSSERLTEDVISVYQQLLNHPLHSDHLSAAPVIIMGHSMGGAIATRATINQDTELAQNLAGLVVIDVVEGTAIEALSGMQAILKGRPAMFNSLEKAIEWAVRSGQTKNVESARLSMPAMLKAVTGKTNNINNNQQPAVQLSRPLDTQCETLQEEPEEEEDNPHGDSSSSLPQANKQNSEEIFPAPSSATSSVQNAISHYEWRVNLFKSESYWHGWFSGLSSAFLNSPSPAKLLLLAGLDRLDKDLTVGQMQGKFQLQVLPQSGHAVHEDLPDQVSQVIATFLTRNKLTTGKSDFTPTFPCC